MAKAVKTKRKKKSPILYTSANKFLKIGRTRHGLFAANPKDLIGHCLMTYGEWEDDSVQLLRSLVSPGDTVIDVGAHIGSITVPLAKAVGSTGLVHAFEPQSPVFQLLNANAALNGLYHVRTHQLLVSNITGCEQSFPLVIPTALLQSTQPMFGHIGGYNYGAAAYDPHSMFYQHGEVLKSHESVDIRTLDSFDFKKVALIKMDLEGHELRALRGAQNVLKRSRPILYLEHNVQSSESQKKELLRFLKKNKYICEVNVARVIVDNNWRHKQIINPFYATMKNYEEHNLLCMHKSSGKDPQKVIERHQNSRAQKKTDHQRSTPAHLDL